MKRMKRSAAASMLEGGAMITIRSARQFLSLRQGHSRAAERMPDG